MQKDTSAESSKDFQDDITKPLESAFESLNIEFIDCTPPLSDEQKFQNRYGSEVYTRVCFSDGESKTMTVKEAEYLYKKQMTKQGKER